MRTLLSSAALATIFAGAAMAADLPRREAAPAPAPAPIYAAPVFTWSGFYVGLNAGATFGGKDRDYRPGGEFLNPNDPAYLGSAAYRSDNDNDAAFTGGAQVGYNWQFGAFVAGIEADINWRGRGRNNAFGAVIDPEVASGDFAGADSVAFSGDRHGSWFATLRPRVGYAMNRTLLYVTGGLAYAKAGDGASAYLYDSTGSGAPIGGVFTSSSSGSDWGWTLGAGVEHAFTNNWTAKLEYLYVDLDRGTRTLTNVAQPDYSFTTRQDDSFHVVRVGLNYKF